MGVHYVRKFVDQIAPKLPDKDELTKTFGVPPTFAYSRHYRNRTTWAPEYIAEVKSFGKFGELRLPEKLLEQTVTNCQRTLIEALKVKT